MPIRSLSNDLQSKAKRELNEVPSRILEDIKHIQEWLAKQSDLNVKKEDQWLLNFIRGCKFNLQRTKDKLNEFYTMKSLLPELFSNRDPFAPEIQEILSLGICLPLPNTVGTAGPRIVLLRCEPADPTKVLFVNVMKVCLMIIDILLNEDDNFVIAGQHAILDLRGMSVNHLIYLDINVCQKVAVCLQHAYPIRLNGFHCVNIPSFFEAIFHMLKPFGERKIINRVHVYNTKNISNMHEIIPLSVLPREYGGNGGSLEDLTVIWKNKIENYRDWFMDDGSNEMRRKQKEKKKKLFNIEQFFQKINIDSYFFLSAISY